LVDVGGQSGVIGPIGFVQTHFNNDLFPSRCGWQSEKMTISAPHRFFDRREASLRRFGG
jgi:hypothetical protein